MVSGANMNNVARVTIIQVETAGGEGSTGPLHDAAKRGNLELVRECLRFAGFIIFIPNKYFLPQ